MKLRDLLAVLCDTKAERTRYGRWANVEITAIVNDSRKVTRGCMFVALQGSQTDGHDFVPDAIRAGAAAIITERRLSTPNGVIQFVLPDIRRRLGTLAARFYGDPTSQLHVTGITGTNGKTTTSFRTRAIHEAAGHRTGLLGTIAYKIGTRNIPAQNTTPDGLAIQDLFAQMVEAGLTHAVIEVSSHALDMHRVDDVHFRVAVFTCLSGREHLDYHKNFENYRDAKARLFEMLPPHGAAAINADDPLGKFMADHAPAACTKLWFGMHNRADVSADVVEMDMTGTTYRLTLPDGQAVVRSRLVGEFNVMNDLAAAAAASVAGVGLDAIVAGLERPDPVPGRMERIPAPDFFPIVDYAHNEGALDSVLKTLAALPRNRLLLVFGCGGDRDRSKRPAMGAAAEKYCDVIFLTADNSRSEDTMLIISEIEKGMSGRRPRYVIPDREEAIREAVKAARPGDILLVAGKGHETYQILGNVKAPFDDREVLRSAVAESVLACRSSIASEVA